MKEGWLCLLWRRADHVSTRPRFTRSNTVESRCGIFHASIKVFGRVSASLSPSHPSLFYHTHTRSSQTLPTSYKMLSRRFATKAARTVAGMRVIPAKRFIGTSVTRQTRNEKIETDTVPVVEYSSGTENPHHTVVKVDQFKPVASPTVDVAKKAFAMEPGLSQKLTPTLVKFTLEGKVALVTG